MREEGQHAAGTLRPGGHVVLFEGRIGAPVHHGMEIQVKPRVPVNWTRERVCWNWMAPILIE